MAVSRQPCITPETSSGEGLEEEPTSRGEAKWKRFHPFRVVRKIFRRRVKRSNEVNDASKKSWSTSELQRVQEGGPGKCDVTSPLKIGLSVSHDSIFSPEGNGNGNADELNVPRGSSLSVCHNSMKNMFKDELFTRVRARRDSDDDDIGLPHSPCTSPTTVDVLTQGLKEKPSVSQTNYSAGSLISMESSENDEDSAGHSSGHSSRMSLLDKRSLDSEGDIDTFQPVPLNHNAAHHKMAVRPKRTYGLPRKRMNQIAAAKISALPVTPEVTEEKTFHVFEATETINTTSDIVFSSTEENLTTSAVFKEHHSTVQSQVFSTSNYDEVSETVHETQIHQIRLASENSQETKKQLMYKTGGKISDTEVEHDSRIMGITENIKDYPFNFESKPPWFDDMAENDILQKTKQIIENIQNDDILKDDSMFEEQGEPLKVSSLVKNIELSDTFKQEIRSETEQVISHSTESKHIASKEVSSTQKTVNKVVDSKHSSIFDKVEDFAPISRNIEKSLNENIKLPLSSMEFLSEAVKKSTSVTEKLDTESEFVFKPLRKDSKPDIESVFDHEKFIEKPNDQKLISTLFPEEESIMSDKSLGTEESRIFISHNASHKDDIRDILVTEAHNFVSRDENNTVSIQTVHETSKEKVSNEPWISSVGITAANTTVTDVTVNSLTSTVCEKMMKEDKVTISVNSVPESEKSKSPSIRQRQEKIMVPKTSDLSETPKSHINAKLGSKERNFMKAAQGSHLPDSGMNLKTTSQQKRLSVEIVPFNQRLKERKSQSISPSNKDISPEPAKKNPVVSVERKLSDRKVIPRNKELDKSNNRHSFSGTISIDNSKKNDEISERKSKFDNVQQTHKMTPKTDNRDVKNARKIVKSDSPSDVKFVMQSAKGKATRQIKEEAHHTEKWEVKIQPASTPVNNTSSLKKGSDAKTVMAKSTDVSKDVTPTLDSPPVRSRENSWKATKDTPPSTDDPEPELLRVFARRSIKQKHTGGDKGKQENKEEKVTPEPPSEPAPIEKPATENKKQMISISQNSTVIKISETTKPHISKPDLVKKKSKSFSEKEKTNTYPVSPLKEINMISRESPVKPLNPTPPSNETPHPRQRFVSVPNISVHVQMETERRNSARNSQNGSSTENSPSPSLRDEHLHRASSISGPSPTATLNGNSGLIKDQDLLVDKDGHAPSWLQLAQQRRELREQRERLLLGSSTNSFLDASSKPSRSSKVWDMVNNFQKLQMT